MPDSPPWEVARVEVEVAEARVPGKQGAKGCRLRTSFGVRYRISWVGWLFHHLKKCHYIGYNML